EIVGTIGEDIEFTVVTIDEETGDTVSTDIIKTNQSATIYLTPDVDTGLYMPSGVGITYDFGGGHTYRIVETDSSGADSVSYEVILNGITPDTVGSNVFDVGLQEIVDITVTNHYLTGILEGHVYLDMNRNGTQDAGEPDLENAEILIEDGRGSYTEYTDANGDWSKQVYAGQVTITVVSGVPAGYYQTEGTNPTVLNVPANGTTFGGEDGFAPPKELTVDPVCVIGAGEFILVVRNTDTLEIPFRWQVEGGGWSSWLSLPGDHDYVLNLPASIGDLVEVEFDQGGSVMVIDSATVPSEICLNEVNIHKEIVGTIGEDIEFTVVTIDEETGDTVSTDIIKTNQSATIYLTPDVDTGLYMPSGVGIAYDFGGGHTYRVVETDSSGADSVTYEVVLNGFSTDSVEGGTFSLGLLEIVDITVTNHYLRGWIEGRVFFDQNGDGTDAGEPGLPDIDVHLTNLDNGQVFTVSTDADGYYMSVKLPAGTYEVD
ncbi:MAG: SdrD B-like domain-containing protein, partial [Saprospiraceae bacterium]|nr:SdrD B-like domain-containing protein [Saprospiraceae bacterium]